MGYLEDLCLTPLSIYTQQSPKEQERYGNPLGFPTYIFWQEGVDNIADCYHRRELNEFWNKDSSSAKSQRPS